MCILLYFGNGLLPIHEHPPVSLGVPFLRYLRLSCAVSLHVSTLNDYPIGNGSEWSVFQVLLPVVLAIFGTQSHGYEVS